MLVKESLIAKELGHTYFERGVKYFKQKRVTVVEYGEDHASATVRGSGDSAYQVLVTLENGAYGLRIEGECSCPIGYNCKHVAATLLAVNERSPVAAQKDTRSDHIPSHHPDETLDHHVRRWLDQLVDTTTEKATPDSATQVSVLFLLTRNQMNGNVCVNVIQARILKSGAYSTRTQRYNISAAFNQSKPAAFLTKADLAIFKRLLWSQWGSDLPLTEESGAEALQRILATERAYWETPQGPKLFKGAPAQAEFEWRVDREGGQTLEMVPSHLIMVATDPIYYINTHTGECGQLHSELPPSMLMTLNRAPRLSPVQAGQVRSLLEQRLPGARLPKPKEIAVEKDTKVKPQVHLTLGAASPSQAGYFPYRTSQADIPYARLEFSYRDIRVSYDSDIQQVTTVKDNTHLIIPRDFLVEETALRKLRTLDMRPLNTIETYPLVDEAHQMDLSFPSFGEWHGFAQYGIPLLEKQGWHITIEEDFPFQYINTDVEELSWYSSLDESDSDWFDFDLGVEVDGERINLLPVLCNLIKDAPEEWELQTLADYPGDSDVLLQVAPGRWIKLDVERVRNLLGSLIELYDHDPLVNDKFRLKRGQVGQLLALNEAMASVSLRWLGADKLTRLIVRLKQQEQMSHVFPPDWFNATLRDYQQEGLNWLGFLREIEMGGILADDMGLGKTIQTLALLSVEKAQGRMDRPCLIVAPTSLMSNWRKEAEKFAPGLKVLVLHGSQRAERFERIADNDLVLTTYPLLPRDSEYLLKQDYHYLILDEAQTIKNPKAQATQLVHRLEARHRLCLTGTPMENHLGELWSLFNFLTPGLLGDDRKFKTLFRTPIEKQGDLERQRLLSRRIKPFMLRRTKQEVATELPEKTEIQRTVLLEGKQRDLYESIRVAMDKKIRDAIAKKGVKRSHIEILDALLKLRQVCCDPSLLKLDSARKVKSSAKLDTLMSMLPSLLEEGRKILLFSQFTSMLGLIEAQLDKAGIEYVKLTGATKDRDTPVNRFQNGEVSLFLISLKAGGVGLNLTAADTVIHYDPWWNPAVENQATDRAYRIGQDKPVFVYKLITEGTVEEKIVELQKQKQALADNLLADKAEKFTFDEEELRKLFAPVE
ncbi:Superfamily II DNA/RNA helicase, SNF2 family [Hahella chejuensis KCTC 2396]|uniref:Superfamily II DNA/RNA helicase, SNF2 family n=1 Tax=Hahella chejuensis (strain KCTC 2396) TaxID=349521 RepID=Q2S6W0_HAHCH|nr:DEAD/DEAH box helicase [Hahella chejuensis]ABC33614.1 Superfamily II DNA/RNA helicase, SNF2 family [Hahella chejuensis KCTC 2396]